MTEVGELLELRVGAPAAGGGFVARDDGHVVFVRHGLPGEVVLARVTEVARTFLRADAIEIREASSDRVTPRCPYAGPGGCGGCDWQHATIEAQRSFKGRLVAEQLRRIAGLELDVDVAEVPGAPGGFGWRTRVGFAVDAEGRVGLHRHRSHDLQTIEHCDLAAAAIEDLGVEGLRWPGVAELEVFAGTGGSDRVVALRSSGARLRAVPDIPAGLVVDNKTMRSPGRVRVSVLGRNFSVSAGVFWQVHPGAASTLGREVLHALGSVHGGRVADLYCGAGLFAALAGRAVGDRGAVLGVERDERACGDAVRNTADLPHVEILHAAVTPRLVAEQLGAQDAVILDPAREGAGRKVMAALGDLDPAPGRIVYVSCDPASFARDLKVLLDAGWGLESLKAFDLFPMTEHVEIVATIRPGDAITAPRH